MNGESGCLRLILDLWPLPSALVVCFSTIEGGMGDPLIRARPNPWVQEDRTRETRT